MLEKNICTIQSILQTGAASFKGNTMSFKQQVHFEENASLSWRRTSDHLLDTIFFQQTLSFKGRSVPWKNGAFLFNRWHCFKTSHFLGKGTFNLLGIDSVENMFCLNIHFSLCTITFKKWGGIDFRKHNIGVTESNAHYGFEKSGVFVQTYTVVQRNMSYSSERDIKGLMEVYAGQRCHVGIHVQSINSGTWRLGWGAADMKRVLSACRSCLLA